MKLLSLSVTFFLSVVMANVSLGHDEPRLGHVSRHVSLVSRKPTSLEPQARRRCRKRPSSSVASSPRSTSIYGTTTKHSTTSPQTVAKPTSTSKAPQPTTSATGNSGGPSGSNGPGKTINLQGPCGNSRATTAITQVSGPNGNIDWLNCGIDGAGWNPPKLALQDVVYKSLEQALAMPNSPFKACGAYISLFNKYGQETGIPPIMIASFALQESSCNPNSVGGGGEQGLMQITKEKCVGAPGGDCKNPDFNIRTGARYFAGRVQANGGNLLVSVGQYNGWVKGMTYSYATRARYTSCCTCQNNLDYLHQFFNGWMQGTDGHSSIFKKYNNLAVCA